MPLRADCQIFFTHYYVLFIHAFFPSNFGKNGISKRPLRKYYFTESVRNKSVWLLPRVLQPLGTSSPIFYQKGDSVPAFFLN